MANLNTNIDDYNLEDLFQILGLNDKSSEDEVKEKTPNEVLYEPYPLGVDDEDNLNKFRENYNRNAIKDTLERILPNDDDIILII